IESAGSIDDSWTKFLRIVSCGKKDSVSNVINTIKDIKNLRFAIVFKNSIDIFHHDYNRYLGLNLPEKSHTHNEKLWMIKDNDDSAKLNHVFHYELNCATLPTIVMDKIIICKIEMITGQSETKVFTFTERINGLDSGNKSVPIGVRRCCNQCLSELKSLLGAFRHLQEVVY